MATIITRAGKATALTASEYDENLKMETRLAAAGTAIAADDNRATVVHTGTGDTFTLPDLSTLLAAEDTGDFIVTIKHGGTAGSLTIDPAAANTIDGTEQNLTLAVAEVVTLKGSTSDNWLIVNRSLPDGTAGYVMRMGSVNPAWHLPVAGARAYRSVAGNVTSGWDYYVYFDTELYDNVSCLSLAAPSGANTSLITVPAGYTWMRFTCTVQFEPNSTGARGCGFIQTNSTAATEVAVDGTATFTTVGNSGAAYSNAHYDSGWVEVVAGEYYKPIVYQNSGSSLDIISSVFSVEFK